MGYTELHITRANTGTHLQNSMTWRGIRIASGAGLHF